MSSTKRINPLVIIIALAAVSFVIIALVVKTKNEPLKTLPYYGNKQVENGDTIYHRIANFEFVDQDGKTVTEKDFEGKIYVTDFFFTTCLSICPVMSTHMEMLTKEFKDEPRVKFLSHTVDPEHDNINVLADYAKAHNANSNQWHLVTGDKAALYRMARESYLLNAEEGDGGPDDFIHTQNFALIDWNKNIRGYYDGTNVNEMKTLIKDIKLLLKQKDFEN
jgi:protein SCO1/2